MNSSYTIIEAYNMFGWLKSDPKKKLDQAYHLKLEQAMQAQRKGDIRSYGELTAQAEQLRSELQRLETVG
jgi:hypothetical protein